MNAVDHPHDDGKDRRVVLSLHSPALSRLVDVICDALSVVFHASDPSVGI